ncbi:L-cystine transporter [Pseudobacillus wudalianchiensis]|uniref:L-cystine uptake protein TcyP n=1 Tax=Pseudobacillus wudalianchiensis TaxID=1743143 RepID=A0A1B9AAR9_9BACI|nr:L-cystine transporter [Bacillus wudalianchiensis]OCA80938.1 sodium:dicarboxylate symporter [Bacillus wudalianchiensis]
MNLFFIIANVVALLLLAGVLYVMQKKHISFSKRVFTALGMGVIFGFILQMIYGLESKTLLQSTEWFSIIGTGYVKLLQMVVMPLVFISIVSAFTKLTLTTNLGKVAGLIIGLLVGTTAIAAAIGISASLGFHLEAVQIQGGETEQARGTEIEQQYSEIENQSFPQKIIELIPANPFLDFTGQRSTSTIAVVIFAAFVGFAYLGIKRKEPEHAEFFKKMIEAIYSIVMRIVTLVLRLTPYGILAIMAKTVATSNFAAIAKLGEFVLASYVALAIMFIIHLLILTLVGLNPMIYVKKAFPVLSFAFTSRSSAGTLPLNIKAQTSSLGVPEGIANFAGSFGLSIGQNGCAGVYPAMLAVMIAPTVGINPLSPTFILTLIAVVAISSFGVAGVGGGATFAAILVLSTMNLPVALAGLLISVEPLIDMARTAVNVSGSMTAGVVTSRITKELDTTVYNEQQEVMNS